MKLIQGAIKLIPRVSFSFRCFYTTLVAEAVTEAITETAAEIAIEAAVRPTSFPSSPSAHTGSKYIV